MKSFTFFRTEEGNYYLYNSRKSSLLNVHPVIKVIEALDNNDGEETLFAKIMNQNLEIGDDEKRLLLDKYLFLRDNGFFEEINEEDFIDGKITRVSRFCRDRIQIMEIRFLTDAHLQVFHDIAVFLFKHICKDTIFRFAGLIVLRVVGNLIDEKQRKNLNTFVVQLTFSFNMR